MKSIFVAFLVLALIPFYAVSQDNFSDVHQQEIADNNDTIGADADKSMRIALMFGGLKNYPLRHYMYHSEGRINPAVALQLYLIEKDRIKVQTGLTFYQRWFSMDFNSLYYLHNAIYNGENVKEAGHTFFQLPFNILYQPLRKVGLSTIIGAYASFPLSRSPVLSRNKDLEMGVRAGLQYQLNITHIFSVAIRSEFEYPVNNIDNIYAMPSLFVLGGVVFKL